MTSKQTFLGELRWRGLLNDLSDGAAEIIDKEKVVAYIGFDPTADSLHVGSLLQIMILIHLQRHGHTPIVLVGGGTGMIGDPSGKSKERNLLTEDQIAYNLDGIKGQLSRFLDFEGVENAAILVNNGEWLSSITLLEFLRDIGKHFTVNYMLAKDSVRSRLDSEDGISFTEFSYMLLQAYDFLTLYDRYQCTFQMGGSDQWGNIVAGFELIRRLRGAKAHGVTVPLVTSSSGAKFGKTESGTVWLDARRTSPYRFYQFWLNQTDDDVRRYLCYFTLLNTDEIAALEAAIQEAPHERRAQKTLAAEVTGMVHGEAALEKAIHASDVLFGGDLEGLTAADLLDIFSEVPSSQIDHARLDGEGIPVVELATEVGLEKSNNRVRELIGSGGLYLNNRRVEDAQDRITLDLAIEGQVLVLRKGRKQYHVVKVTE